MTETEWQALVERTTGGDVTPGTMFGCRGLRTGRKFFAIRWEEQLVVKLPAQRLEELVAAGRAEPFEPVEGRRMNGWVLLHAANDWLGVSAEARAFVQSQRN